MQLAGMLWISAAWKSFGGKGEEMGLRGERVDFRDHPPACAGCKREPSSKHSLRPPVTGGISGC